MNIFILSNSPQEAAKFHCDKHNIKMILEHCQLLSSALNIHSNNTIEGTYKTTHINHPCTIWARQTKANFLWLCEMTEELFQEYTRRYGKHHKSYSVFQVCRNHANLIPEGELTAFAQAMPEQYRNSDAVTAYRTYYLNEKKDFCKWKNGNIPFWWNV
jgi:hypothetical protein